MTKKKGKLEPGPFPNPILAKREKILCQNCDFFYFIEERGLGQCKRYAPRAPIFPLGSNTVWPLTYPHDSCGDFLPAGTRRVIDIKNGPETDDFINELKAFLESYMQSIK